MYLLFFESLPLKMSPDPDTQTQLWETQMQPKKKSPKIDREKI